MLDAGGWDGPLGVARLSTNANFSKVIGGKQWFCVCGRVIDFQSQRHQKK